MKTTSARSQGKASRHGSEPTGTANRVKLNQPMRDVKYRGFQGAGHWGFFNPHPFLLWLDNSNLHFRFVLPSSCLVTLQLSLGSCMQHRQTISFLVLVGFGFGSFWFFFLMAESQRLIPSADEVPQLTLIKPQLVFDEENLQDRVLIGKVFAPRVLNKGSVKKNLEKLWKHFPGVHVTDLTSNIFECTFPSKNQAVFVLAHASSYLVSDAMDHKACNARIHIRFKLLRLMQG